MTRFQALASRLVEWFTGQPELIQSAVLGLCPDSIKQDVAKLVLQKIAEGKDEPQESMRVDGNTQPIDGFQR